MALMEQGVILYMLFCLLTISLKENIKKFIIAVLFVSIVTVLVRTIAVTPLIIIFCMFSYFIFILYKVFDFSFLVASISVGLIFLIYVLLESTLLPLASIIFNINLTGTAKYSTSGIILFLVQMSGGILLGLIIKKTSITRHYKEFLNINRYNINEYAIDRRKVLKGLYLTTLFLILQGFLLLSINWIEKVYPYFKVSSDYSHIINNGVIIIFTVLLLFLFNRLLKLFKYEHKKIIQEVKEEVSLKLDQELKKHMHDIKNHLGTLNMMLQMNKINRAKKYLRGIIDNVSTIQQNIQTGQEGINALLYSKINQAHQNSINLEVEVVKPISNLNIPEWDINRIIGNLIDNAIEAVKKLDDTRKIKILLEGTKIKNLIKVNTYGVVIPDEVEQQIFKKGYTSKNEKGHGLGLHICQQLVENYQGKIYIEKSDKPPITSFTVELPKGEKI
ncbi:MAG: sensor histidine kinase [Bacillota bacterium]